MKIHLVSVGTRMSAWVEEGFAEYAKRLPRECRLLLVEVPAVKRAEKSNVEKILQEEGKRLLAVIPKGAYAIALDRLGNEWDTLTLSAQLKKWLAGGCDVALLVGGPEGLSAEVLQASRERWSLSRLTYPHPLVRVVLAEQLYRAHSLLKGLPYHR
jgi:23S rRNA (pseudouridine1915-N3)-methyltransferase